MKAKRFLTVFCAGFAILLCVTLIGLMTHQPAQGTMPLAPPAMSQVTVGTIATGQPVFGSTVLDLSLGTAAGCLNLANSAAGAATTSIPCYNLSVSANTVGCYLSSGSASTSCKIPIPVVVPITPTTSGGTSAVGGAAQPVPLVVPATNVNQIWCYNTTSGTAAAGTTVISAMYTK